MRLSEEEAWRAQCREQLERDVLTRVKYGFCHVHKPVLDEVGMRAFSAMAQYREWCAGLPAYLGYLTGREGCARNGSMTLLEILQSTTAYFEKRAIESPRLNAEHLLAHSLGRKRIELYLEFERTLTEAELTPLRELVRRRGQGEPLQHLLGSVEFCGRTFLCDQRALIPRPETEELVEQILRSTIDHEPSTILDVGTGSGVIALSLAAELPKAEVHAVDISEDALALAARNAKELGLENRVHFARSDLLAQTAGKFDLIVANLPYVPTSDRTSLSREVRHDPETAVFGGEAGDEIIRRLIAAATTRLRPGGLLALEIGIGQAEALSSLFVRKRLQRYFSATRLCGCDTIPLCQVWIKSSFTAAILSPGPSGSAGRRIRLCRSWPRPC